MRRLLKWGWIAGVLPLSHTWLLPGEALESSFMPVYLLLVFVAGAAAWWLMEHGPLLPAVAFLLVGWGLSALQGQFGESADFGWRSSLVVLAWLALSGSLLVYGRRASFVP